eukprot:1198141-Prymnesium_polylepis.2
MGTADAGKPQTTGNSHGRSRCPSKEALGAARMTETAAEATFWNLTPAARDDGSGRGASRRPLRFLDALPAHYDPTTDPLPQGSFRAPAQGTLH